MKFGIFFCETTGQNSFFFFLTSFYPQESVRFPNHFLTPVLNWWSPTSHYDSIATSWTFRVRVVISLQAPYTWQHDEKSNSRTSLLLHHSSIPYSHSLTFFEPTFFLWYAETIIPRRSIIFLKHFTISFHSYFFLDKPRVVFYILNNTVWWAFANVRVLRDSQIQFVSMVTFWINIDRYVILFFLLFYAFIILNTKNFSPTGTSLYFELLVSFLTRIFLLKTRFKR